MCVFNSVYYFHVLRATATALLLVFSVTFNAIAQPQWPELPEPVSNNGVVKVTTAQGDMLVSLMGLAKDKTPKDVHNRVWTLNLSKPQSGWQAHSPVPSSLPTKGRLASAAVAINGNVLVFGGYTVEPDLTEVSSPDNFRYDPVKDRYTELAPIPVPVDDAVAAVYQNRFVYLVSGWHNDGNVNLVQVYDAKIDSWHQASPFLGAPVFGHAGALLNNTLLICDGVAVHPQHQKRRIFAMETACYIGQIDADNFRHIDWRRLDHPTGVGRYRMASIADPTGQQIIFAGGSTNPYNFNGIGYDGKPSEPSDQVWAFHLKQGQWQVYQNEQATMDHRGMVEIDERWWVIGGMAENQRVLQTLTEYKLR